MESSNRLQSLTTNFFAGLENRIHALVASGADVIRLDIGSPDLPPSAEIIAALSQSARSPAAHGYSAHLGPRQLRQAWAGMYARLYNVNLDPDREVIPLIGSKEGIAHLPLAVINPGELVLIPDPGYITYTHGALLAGGTPYYLPLRAERGWLPDLEAIPAEVAARARLLWLNYPNNPTAATAPLEFFQQAVAFAQRYGLLVCHDAAYTQVTFDQYRAPSLLEVPGARQVAVEFNTLSKSHNMAGWRVAAALGNAQALAALFKLKTSIDSGHFGPIQQAAIQAMNGSQDWLAGRNAIYQARREAVVAALRECGLAVNPPQGSLYVWCPVPDETSAAGFVSQLLERANVSLTPGSVFGPGGEGYVRISLTAPLERIQEAMERVRTVLCPV